MVNTTERSVRGSDAAALRRITVTTSRLRGAGVPFEVALFSEVGSIGVAGGREGVAGSEHGVDPAVGHHPWLLPLQLCTEHQPVSVNHTHTHTHSHTHPFNGPFPELPR